MTLLSFQNISKGVMCWGSEAVVSNANINVMGKGVKVAFIFFFFFPFPLYCCFCSRLIIIGICPACVKDNKILSTVKNQTNKKIIFNLLATLCWLWLTGATIFYNITIKIFIFTGHCCLK